MAFVTCPACQKQVRPQDAKCWSCKGSMVGVSGSVPVAPSLSAAQRARLAEPPVPKCPKCGSLSLSAQKKGYGWVKGLVGSTLGGIGALGGFVGSRKVYVTCLNCGKSWTP